MSLLFERWSIGTIGRRVALLIGVGSGAISYYERPMPSNPELVKKQWNIWRKEDLADVADEKEDILLKVSNHGSTLDDPCVILAMLPWDIKLRPTLYRCGLCTEDICFTNALYSTVFGAGKVMPIRRGGGIDQLDLTRFSRRLAAGSWCHIFPEGKTVQTGSIGGSLHRAANLGKLKWGVGKMVAHCPVLPEIIPVFHTGMQNVNPESPETKVLLFQRPRLGEMITIQVGTPIFIQDLITKHEAIHGKLRKIPPHAISSSVQPSTSEERMLYSAITLRIQLALEDMVKETRQKLGPDYPEHPRVVVTGEWKQLVGK